MCYKPKTIAMRSYVVTPYHLDDEGNVVAQCPTVCTHATPGQDHCELYLDHSRDRKTGPPYSLAVLRCRTHAIAFTLYPPGFTPWGRKPWVHLSPDGDELSHEPGSEGKRGTYFDAAIDAANGVGWPREEDPDAVSSLPSYVTQSCQLQRSARLLGFEQHPLEAFTQTLQLQGQMVHQALSAISTPPTPVALGRFVVDILQSLRPDLPSLFERLVAGGAAVGLWPPVFVWRPRIGRLVPRRFYHAEFAIPAAGP